MSKIAKIYLMDRDRALEIMWYCDAYYDATWSIHFYDVADKVTWKEWATVQMYFQNGYSAPAVIKRLQQTNSLLCF